MAASHALLTRPLLTYTSASFHVCPFNLHVLSTPPAFVLSQDQTLEYISRNASLPLLLALIKLSRFCSGTSALTFVFASVPALFRRRSGGSKSAPFQRREGYNTTFAEVVNSVFLKIRFLNRESSAVPPAPIQDARVLRSPRAQDGGARPVATYPPFSSLSSPWAPPAGTCRGSW